MADRLDLRRDVQFGTRVRAAEFDESCSRWVVSTDAGQEMSGRFLVMASRPFAIHEVEGDGDGFRVNPPDTERKPVHVVTFTYRPDDGTSRGDVRHAFRVVTDVPGEAPLEVVATVHVEP